MEIRSHKSQRMCYRRAAVTITRHTRVRRSGSNARDCHEHMEQSSTSRVIFSACLFHPHINSSVSFSKKKNNSVSGHPSCRDGKLETSQVHALPAHLGMNSTARPIPDRHRSEMSTTCCYAKCKVPEMHGSACSFRFAFLIRQAPAVKLSSHCSHSQSPTPTSSPDLLPKFTRCYKSQK